MLWTIVLWGLVGLLLGGPVSALSAQLPRRTRGELSPGVHHCCQPGKAWTAALPVIGHGARECSGCSVALRERTLTVEFVLAGVFALLAWRFGLGWPLVIYSLFSAVFVLVFYIDLHHRLIHNVVVYPSIVIALGLMFFTVGPQRALLGAALAGGIFLGFYVLGLVLYRGSGALGEGDVKLALLIGLLIGLPAAFSAVLAGAVFGGIMAVAWLVIGRGRHEPMPYGPALVAGAITAILIDPSIWR